ncbi:Integrase zinc binding domain [Popillia japonica]|uniref:RNA-directed DNA polymerase n=1 Tax=Popillia japonica TaxID=7064 RepID=A0AAW1LWZ5_POPJA
MWISSDYVVRTVTNHNNICNSCLYRYKRLSFGINAAAEIFQDIIRQTLLGIPQVLNISDDILIYGRTQEEHDMSLRKVLHVLKEKHLTINVSKCIFNKAEVKFFGYLFTKNGIYPDPHKVNAIIDLEEPKTPTEVRSFLGMVNYIGKFLPRLASYTKNLRELTFKNKEWVWNELHQKEFETIKQLINKADKITYFDPNNTDHKPLVHIFKNSTKTPSARIERLILKTQRYSFDIRHQKGSLNPADYLSRHPLEETEKDKTRSYLNFLISNNLPKKITEDEVRKETHTDPDLQTLTRAIRGNEELWKTNALKPFAHLKLELTVLKGIVLRGTRIIIPKSLQLRTIELAHRGHQGIVRTKQMIRSKVWFPNIDKITEKLIKSCVTCQAVDNAKHRDSICVRALPGTPFENIDVDFAGPFPNGKYIFIAVDEYSRFPIAEVVNSTSFESIGK